MLARSQTARCDGPDCAGEFAIAKADFRDTDWLLDWAGWAVTSAGDTFCPEHRQLAKA